MAEPALQAALLPRAVLRTMVAANNPAVHRQLALEPAAGALLARVAAAGVVVPRVATQQLVMLRMRVAAMIAKLVMRAALQARGEPRARAALPARAAEAVQAGLLGQVAAPARAALLALAEELAPAAPPARVAKSARAVSLARAAPARPAVYRTSRVVTMVPRPAIFARAVTGLASMPAFNPGARPSSLVDSRLGLDLADYPAGTSRGFVVPGVRIPVQAVKAGPVPAQPALASSLVKKQR